MGDHSFFFLKPRCIVEAALRVADLIVVVVVVVAGGYSSTYFKSL